MHVIHIHTHIWKHKRMWKYIYIYILLRRQYPSLQNLIFEKYANLQSIAAAKVVRNDVDDDDYNDDVPKHLRTFMRGRDFFKY